MDNNQHEHNHPSQAHNAHPQKKGFNSHSRSYIRQFSSFISLLIMVPVFGLLTLFVCFFPRSTESVTEKRTLDSFPAFSLESYFSGNFTLGEKGINHWFTDTVAFRDQLNDMGNGFRSSFGITDTGSGVISGEAQKVNDKSKNKSNNNNNNNKETSKEETSVTEVTPDTSGSGTGQQSSASAPESSAEESSRDIKQTDYRSLDADYTVENGYVIVNQDGHYRAMELFGGGTGNAYVDSLNTLRDTLDSSIKMYSMIAPLSSEYYIPANYEDYTVNQKEYIDDVYSRLKDGITCVDVDSVLAKHTSEDIYCRTDHHWTPLGAYYATEEFARVAGLDTFKDLSTFKPETYKGFVGTMYAMTGGNTNIKDDPEDFTYYYPDNYDKTETDYYDEDFNYVFTGGFYQEAWGGDAYIVFFGGNDQIVKVRTNVKNGRKIVIVKDSYGNPVPSYLMNSFEEIYVVDIRYFNLNLVDFINQRGITDVLFAVVVYSAFGDNSYEIPDLLTQNPGQTIVDHYKDD